MAIQPSSCETIVGMYNIYLNNEKVPKKMVLSVQYEYRCIQCSVWAQMIMCECLDYYVFYLEYVKSVCRVVVAFITHRIVTTDGI